MKQIQRVEVPSNTSSVVFNLSGVTGYRDLLLVLESRSTRSTGNGGYSWVRVNGVGSSGSYFHYSIYSLNSGTTLSVGSAAGAYHPTSNTGYSNGAWAGWAAQPAGNSSGSYALTKMYIPNYSQTNFVKNTLAISTMADVSDANPNYSSMHSSTYVSTSAITSLDIRAYDDTTYWSFVAGTVLTLFGLPELTV